jgi:hypothetical protein
MTKVEEQSFVVSIAVCPFQFIQRTQCWSFAFNEQEHLGSSAAKISTHTTQQQ